MTRLLREVLERADGPDPVATADSLRRFPAGEVAALEGCGLLAPLPAATAVGCDSCGESHVEAVVWADTPGGPPRAFLWCPSDGRVRVSAERLRRWAVRAVAAGRLISTGEPAERLPGRVWGLGAVSAGGTTWAGWLVAGWHGESRVAEWVPELAQPNAAVFVPATLPPAGVWGRSAPRRVVPLAAVLTLTADGLAVDLVAFAAHLGPPDDTPPTEPTAVPPEPDGVPPAIPFPPGTPWEEVTIEVDDHHVVLSTPGRRQQRVGYEALGLTDRRTRAPDGAWKALTLLAATGELAPPDGTRTKSGTLKNHLTRLRAALRRLTGLNGDPFHPTKKLRPYRPRFRIRPATAERH